MKTRFLILLPAMLSLFVPMLAQNTIPAKPTPIAATAPTVVPTLVPYSGVALASNGKPLAGQATMTFQLFTTEQGGEPLWTESQVVDIDAAGHYQVQLGATLPSGLPLNTFASGEGRWLEIQIAGQPQQPRVLIMSVPYAMKAADAATLGGLPASAYALAGTPTPIAQIPSGVTPDSSSTVTTPGGTTGYLPVFSAAATIDDSTLFQSGTYIGVGTTTPAAKLDVEGSVNARGLLTLENAGTATASIGDDSQPLAFIASAYDSSTKKATAPEFEFKAEPSANDTAAPGATLNLLYGNGVTPAETGLSLSSKGIFKFATGQTFPGTGEGTITGITTTSPLSGSGTSGSVAVSLDVSTLETTLNTKYAQLGAANTFTAPITFASAQTFPGTIAGVTAGTGLKGGGTSGNVTLTVDTTKIPSLTGTPVFTSTTHPAISGEGTSGAVGVYGSSDTNWAGEFINSSANYASVYSSNSASTTSASFYGTTSGSHSHGVESVTNGADSTSFDGYAYGAGSYGVFGYAAGGLDALHNPPVGVYGQVQEGGIQSYGVEGSSPDGVGVYGVTSNGDGTGVWGAATTGTAVHAIATTGTAGYFVSSPTDGASVYIFNEAAKDSSGAVPYALAAGADNGVGVYGHTWGGSTTADNLASNDTVAGIWGDAGDEGGSGTAAGVLGTADGATAGAFYSSGSSYFTLYAQNQSTVGGGIFFANALYAEGFCEIETNGDLSCNGTTINVVKADNGARSVQTYSMQEAENWLEDFGSGQLVNGVAHVNLEPVFAQTVNTGVEYHVFLTPKGECEGLYVTNEGPNGFDVHELHHGTSSIAFEYRIAAKRNGYENARLVDVTEHVKAMAAQHPVRPTNVRAHAPILQRPAPPTPPAMRTPQPRLPQLQGPQPKAVKVAESK